MNELRRLQLLFIVFAFLVKLSYYLVFATTLTSSFPNLVNGFIFYLLVSSSHARIPLFR